MSRAAYRKFLMCQGSPLAYLAALGMFAERLDDTAEA